MSSTDITIEGLDEFERNLSKLIEHDYPEEFKKMVIQIANDLRDTVKDKTPVKTSRLQDNWFVGDIVKRGNEYIIEVYNNIEYAEPVEHGHRTKNGGFVEGAHMMEISVEELNVLLPMHIKNWLSKFISEHEL